MKSFKMFIIESDESDTGGIKRLPWNKDPKIGWHEDGDTLIMHHGTHERNLKGIAQNGINAPNKGPTKGWVSMTHDPNTAHGYASMTGGESAFRSSNRRPTSTPHHERATIVAHIPRTWAQKNMDHHFRGNTDDVVGNLRNKQNYQQHKAAGKPDNEYYQKTELRFKQHIPPEFIKGYMKKYEKPE